MKTKDMEVIPGISPHTLRIDEIREGDEGSIEAAAPERAAVAELLDLSDLSRLALTYSLHRLGQGRLGLKGRLTVKLTQTCVVSLEPLPQELDVPVEVAFWPSSQIRDMEKATAEDPVSQGILDWPESIIDGKIDLGPVLYEGLATALEPYPRAKGVEFAWIDPASAGEEAPAIGPFAALKQLKQP
jgi:uncharacterized metal-binding protein YceD (DUF177 family)